MGFPLSALFFIGNAKIEHPVHRGREVSWGYLLSALQFQLNLHRVSAPFRAQLHGRRALVEMVTELRGLRSST